MCALLDEASQFQEPIDQSGSKKKTILVLIFIVLISLGVVALYNKYFSPSEPMPLAVSVLVKPDPSMEGVLPHTIDSATEFNDSFETLQEGVEGPDFRETEVKTSGKAIGIEDVGGDNSTQKSMLEFDNPDKMASKSNEPKGKVLVQESLKTEADDTGITVKKIEPEKEKKSLLQRITSKDEPETETVRYTPGKDWEGTVLVPNEALLSKAYSSEVSLARIEAHPLSNNHLRVWARVKNETADHLNARVACNFRSTSDEAAITRFIPVRIPVEEAVDVYFVSPMDAVKAYTVLVK